MDAFEPTMDDMAAEMLLSGLGSLSLESIISGNKATIKEIKSYDPILLACSLGSLLTRPELQSNCVRLEALTHLALAIGNGRRKPTEGLIRRLFSRLEKSVAGRSEDPAEDVFVSSIATPRGNFRIIEGIWESAGFYLQRIVNALELIPAGKPYDQIRDCVYALLTLSDIVCERANLVRNQLGAELPCDTLPLGTPLLSTLLENTITFNESDLPASGVSLDSLSDFIFSPNDRSGLLKERIGHSTLERYPIVYRDGQLHLVMSTAVSSAIRRYVIEKIDILRLRRTFVGTLAFEYARLFSDTALLGEQRGAPLEFRETSSAHFAGAVLRIDHGRYLNFVFFVDNLEGFEKSGLTGVNTDSDPRVLSADIDRWIGVGYDNARKDPDFLGVLTMVVGCGVGRSAVSLVSGNARENSRMEFVSAADLLTLSWIPKFDALSLWGLIEDVDRLKKQGVELYNINGLLNLVAWSRYLEGHLVPHSQLPEEFGQSDVPNFIMINQNGLRQLRHESAVEWDVHVAPEVSGRWIGVRRYAGELFDEDRNQPFYAAEEQGGEQWPFGLYESEKRPWWCLVETRADTPGRWAHQRFLMLKTWVCRAVPVLESTLTDLPPGPVCLKVRFEGQIGDKDGNGERVFLSYDEARTTISASADASNATVTLAVLDRFEAALFHKDNIAERAIVASIVDGFAALANQPLPPDEHERIVNHIVPNTSARQSHVFLARNFRDYVRHSVPSTPVKIDASDSAGIKLGLGWRVRDRAAGGDIRGKDECTRFLNSIVRLLEDDLCADLRELRRASIIESALINHESAISDRDNWLRTSAAVLALHEDREATLNTMGLHDASLNAVFQATRLLVEFAICESPVDGGRPPGRLDLSRLMGKVLLISGLGGWSDAIRWDAMEPRLRVTPLGDIQAEVTFQKKILEPYGRAGNDIRIEEGVTNYAKNLDEADVVTSTPKDFPQEFWHALEEEFGASFETIRKFIDFLEDLGIDEGAAVLTVPKSQILRAELDGTPIAPIEVAALVERMTFQSRSCWRDVPEGYTEKDRQPWRFRRPLSVLRRPLLQINNDGDPLIIVAPGLVRDAFSYMIGNYHRGDFPLAQLKPKMKRWAGFSRDQAGNAFTKIVASRLEELGWVTETEIKITKLLRKGFDKDYGDVDVLAWNNVTGRVLIIECKDVQYRKIEGEIAEQLADFRGELRSNSKPDLLLKHLNRMNLINDHTMELMKHIGWSAISSIESHLVFKNPVPMQFAIERLKNRVELHVFASLDQI